MPDASPKIRTTEEWYVIDGRSYPRVSTVLEIIHEPGLDTWREKVGEEEAKRISEESTLLGDAVHASCANLSLARMGRDPLPLDPKFEPILERLPPFVEAFTTWLDTDVAEVLYVEETVWSDGPVYAGTIDLVVRRKDGAAVIYDLKTSKRIRTKYRLQTAAYLNALRERAGLVADYRGIVHLPSDRPGKLKAIPFYDFDDDWQAFEAALFLRQYIWFYRRDFIL